jgi:hypothetical protein
VGRGSLARRARALAAAGAGRRRGDDDGILVCRYYIYDGDTISVQVPRLRKISS